jgi:hypothetical protein
MAAAMRASLAALLVSGILLAGCSGSDDPGTSPGASSQPAGTGTAPNGPPPQLHVGDHWTHESVGGGATATTEVTVMAIEDHDGESAYRIEGTIETSASGFSFDAEMTSWVRVSDHAKMEEESTADIPYLGESTTTTTYEPPCVELRWPLTIGASWTVTCTATTTTGSGSQASTNTTKYTVEAQEGVQVPAGSFDDAFRLRVEAEGQTHRMWVSLEACGMVKLEATSDGQTVTTELSDYEC